MKVNGIEFKEIEKTYLSDKGMFEEKEIMLFMNELSIEDRRLLILYAELGSLRAVAKIYNCSHKMIHKRITKIRKKYKNLNI